MPLLILILLLTSCANRMQVKEPLHWAYTNYSTCVPVLTQASLPFALAVNINRRDLPFGRYSGLNSNRVFILNKDGSTTSVGETLFDSDKPGEESLFFQDWSLDGQTLFLTKGWEDPTNAMLEELTKQIMISPSAYREDVYAYSNMYTNLTQRSLSYFNAGVFIWANDPTKLGIGIFLNGRMTTALLDLVDGGVSSLSKAGGFTYGAQSSPDGTRYSFHSDYQAFIGDIASGTETHIKTPFSFNFRPVWSPDSNWVVFLCGNSNEGASLCLADRNGNNFKKLTNRGGYSGSVAFINGSDFHGGQTDFTAWTSDSKQVIYSANSSDGNQLFEIDIATGVRTELTKSAGQNYMPSVSSDGKWLAFTSTRTGRANVFLMDLQTLATSQVTDLVPGCGVMVSEFRPI